MAINTTTRSAGPYTCDGTVSSFAFSFKVFSSDDVLVTASTPGASAGGSVVLVYTVTLNPDQDNFPGGYVVFTPAPSVGTTVLIGSRVTPVQTSVLQQLGGYYPKVIENALDRLTILVQQLYTKFARTITLDPGVDTSTVSSVFPSPVATNLIGWDATATTLKNYSQAQLLSQLFTASLYGQTNAQSATGDGSNRTFTLGSSAGNVNNVQVYVAGARLRPTTDYQLGPDGKTVTLTTAPSNGAQVLFVWQSVLPVSSLAFTSEFQTAADGQAVFTLTTVTYAAGSPGALSVFVNGLRVKKGVDYSETSSSVVTFTNGLVAGDDVEFLVGSQVGSQGPAGPTGPTGATGATGATGPAGTSAFTNTSASFTQPSIGGTVSVTFANTAWMAQGQILYVVGGGYYTLISITDSAHAVLSNLGYSGNASPGASVTSGAAVTAGGTKGQDGAGSGTVTSVALSAPAFLSVSGSPVTGAGTLALSYSGAPLPTANGGTGSTTSTGSGANVLSSGATMTGLTVDGLNGGQLAGFRNVIINGGCQVAQRGALSLTGNSTPSTVGGCDRIIAYTGGFTTATGTLQQQQPGFGTTGYSQAITGLTTTGSGFVEFQTRLESKNTAQLNGKNITISAKLYQTTGSTQTAYIRVQKANSVDNFGAVTVLNASGALSVASGTPVPVSATFTLGASDASNGLMVEFYFSGVGAITSKDFHITDIQLEQGYVATPFEFRQYGTELALCQRYYYQTPGAGTNRTGTEFCSQNYVSATTAALGTFVFPVQMRTTPTVLNYGRNSTAGGAYLVGVGNVTGVSVYAYDKNGINVWTGTSFTVGQNLEVAFTASAEL